MDFGAFAGRTNLQLAAELPHAFAHTKKTDSEGRGFLASSKCLSGYAASMVDDVQMDLAVLNIETHDCCGTSRMTVNIGKAFLNHAKYCDLEFDREAPQCCRQIQLDVDSAS